MSTDFHAQNQSSDVESNQQDSPYEQQQNGAVDADDDEEDYSISVSAIMQRRASVRGYRGKRGSRNSRRASSPMDHVLDSVERRRSSVYTTSSGKAQCNNCFQRFRLTYCSPVANQCVCSCAWSEEAVVVISAATCAHLVARG